MRGWTTSRWPLANRNTACLARRLTSSTVLPRRVFRRRGFETRRSTSVFARRARAIRYPSSRGASSRTIVSTSGSSGTPPPPLPRDLPPTDVPPPRLALEHDQLAAAGALPRRLGHAVAQGGHGEHPPAVHPQRAVGVAIGARVEHQGPGVEIAWHHDRRAELRLAGVAGRREHRGHRGAGRPADGLRPPAASPPPPPPPRPPRPSRPPPRRSRSGDASRRGGAGAAPAPPDRRSGS